MTRAVSVGRSFKGLWAAGALGLTLLTISSWAGCAGSLDPSAFPTGGAGSSGMAGSGAAGTGIAGTTGMAGTGPTPGCDVTPLVTKYTCTTMSVCHDAMGSGANFNMAAADWTTHLVNVVPKGGGAVPSICGNDPMFKTLPYIKKGDPNGDGLFLQKLQGAICSPGGAQMPLLNGPMTAPDLMCFKQFATALANQ
jgi:hypothetical protein